MPHHPKGRGSNRDSEQPSHETLRQRYGRLRLELNVYDPHRSHRRDSLTADELRDDVIALAEFIFGLAGELDDDRKRLDDVEVGTIALRNLPPLTSLALYSRPSIEAIDRIRERVVLRRQEKESDPAPTSMPALTFAQLLQECVDAMPRQEEIDAVDEKLARDRFARELVGDLDEVARTLHATIKLGYFDEGFADLATRLEGYITRLRERGNFGVLSDADLVDELVRRGWIRNWDSGYLRSVLVPVGSTIRSMMDGEGQTR